MKKIAVVGAGLVGSMLSEYLAKRGYNVDVFERRPDLRNAEIIGGRSINLALSTRGWKALQGIDLEARVREISLPMKGRSMHAKDGTLTFQKYGKDDQAIYSVSRGMLNQIMLNAADENEHVVMYFDRKCLDIDLKTNTIKFENTVNGEVEKRRFDHIFGTDGAFSAIRRRLQKTDRFNYSQFYLKHGYKELTIPPNNDGSHKIDKEALHIWPRGEFMLIALPNLDGSFTVTLFLPFEGITSFNTLDTDEKVWAFFQDQFPDVLELMPGLISDWHENPKSSLVTVKCSPWNVQDKVLILGDASHGIVPFYGQGMNSGFEDCTLLAEVMDSTEDWLERFDTFSRKRKPDTDAIAELAFRNHIEMRDKTGDPKFLLQKKIESRFYSIHPEKWMPLYSQVTFSHIPYSEALATGDKQQAIMDVVMEDPEIENNWDSQAIEKKILSLI